MWALATRHTGQRDESRVKFLVAALLVGCGSVACKGTLDVELPTRVGADALDNPGIAQTLVNSAIGEFECAFPYFVMAGGEITDELRHSSAWYAETIWNRRDITRNDDALTCPSLIGNAVYIPLQKARFSAEDTKRRIEQWSDAQVPQRTDKLAQVTAYGAYARTLLGESYCAMAIDGGPLMPLTDVLKSAEQEFGEAIASAQTAGDSAIKFMALVGRARVRLDLGQNAGAKTDASAVRAGFKQVTHHSTADPRRWNQIYRKNYLDEYNSVTNEFLNVTFGGVPDPRVKVVPAPKPGHDGSSTYLQTKYTAYDTPIVLASWEEAQLIIAEVDLGQSAVDIINALHAAVGLPPYTPVNVNDNTEILNQVIQERSRQLYLEGHRLNDFLRHNLPFHTGASPYDGVRYGTTTCFPLPFVEINGNPNIPK
jgi:hypothetical protein